MLCSLVSVWLQFVAKNTSFMIVCATRIQGGFSPMLSLFLTFPTLIFYIFTIFLRNMGIEFIIHLWSKAIRLFHHHEFEPIDHWWQIQVVSSPLLANLWPLLHDLNHALFSQASANPLFQFADPFTLCSATQSHTVVCFLPWLTKNIF